MDSVHDLNAAWSMSRGVNFITLEQLAGSKVRVLLYISRLLDA